MVVVACAVVSEDSEFLGSARLSVAGTAKSSSKLACVMVVIFALHDSTIRKGNTTMGAECSLLKHFSILGSHDQPLLLLLAETPVDTEPKELAHEREKWIEAVVQEDLSLELLRNQEALTTHCMHTNAGDMAVLSILLCIVQTSEEGLNVRVDDQLMHESMMPVLELYRHFVHEIPFLRYILR